MKAKFRRFSFMMVLVMLIGTLFLNSCGGGSSSGNWGPSPSPQPPLKVGAGAGAASDIISGLLSGLGSFTSTKCLGWILSIIGTGGNSDSQLQADVDAMNSKLTEIINDLEVIQGELSDILNAIHISMDVILNNEQVLDMKVPQDVINNEFINLQAMNSTMIGTPDGRTQADSLATDIVSTSGSNIDLQVYEIYSGVMGITAGLDGGALNAFTDTLVDHAGDGQMLNRYISLETYFKQLLQIQLKGAAMMVDGLHHRDNPWPSGASAGVSGWRKSAQVGPGDYPGTATQWMNEKFQPMLADEVEEFLRCADRIVLAECDLRTDLTTTDPAVAMLPTDADAVWTRADFIAAQISPARHSFGLNVRLAGEPDEIHGFATGRELTADSPGTSVMMTLVPLGNSGAPGYPARLSPVEVWNNWPSGYTQAYMQWNWGSYATGTSAGTVSGHIAFNQATSIGVTKFATSHVTGLNVFVSTNYPNEQATIGTESNPAPLMNYYDDDMNVVTSSTAGAHYYGHGTLTIRHRPEVWYQYLSTTNGQDVYHGTADCYLGPNVWVRTIVSLKQNYWGVDEDFDFESGIAVPIINGSTSEQKVSVNMNVQADANNSFHQIFIDQNQDRITAYWEWNNTPEWDWWGIQMGTGVTYPGSTAYHNFDPGEAHPYQILVKIANNASGNEGNSLGCRVWAQTLYLFF
ncbi:MAG: hypothetical protein V2A78_08740 [bacterium]